MKAIVCTSYGAPDVLQLQEVGKPSPKDHEIRIRVAAASVGPSDSAFRQGNPYLIRLMYGFKKPRHSIPGTELSGVVDEVGKNVTSFKPGDRVWGLSPSTFGAHAEYKCLPEKAPLIVQSSAMTSEEAVALSDGAPTALTFLRDKAKVRPGQRVLINGASGAVGAYAVQLAKHYGAEVTGVCSGANAALVTSLGADRVIDYTRTDFTREGRSYDVIFDAVGKRSFGECRGALASGGIYLTTEPSLSIVFHMLRTSLSGGKKAMFATAGLMQNKQNLAYLQELYERGKLRAVIDRLYPLEQAAEAHRYVDTGRKKGNVIVTM
ncbi:NAD(P)-dependent alcohol dehydrogenase [Paenibacillus soyae]|uniref:NAD(P)-dependent alcohol dehydrogenase n=1 Tax=Paenibacillus soyae TaxID=2969249 RepID=A0A9X2MT40_9BACL|nr:NAD(P)-dependent alcohol dehydrogenase [Paenibacillus soyae]MCR2805965.1 NAD(P)-dependent alcohol dehydrogenase [Paenibacillus soyae]